MSRRHRRPVARGAALRMLLDRSTLAVAAALACLAGLALAVPGSLGIGPVAQAGAVSADRAADACRPSWVTAWHAAPQAAPAPSGLTGTTLRMVVQPQVAGSQVRLRLSNAYGETPLRIGAASVAESAGGADLRADTLSTVTFDDQPAVTVPDGADVVSDPVPLDAAAGRPLAVSLHLVEVPDVLTQHAGARQTSFRSGRGDATRAGARAFPDRAESWSVLTGLDVLPDRAVNALVAVGDSITDGVGSGVDADERWTDALARRMADPAAPPEATMVVLNGGISRNRLLDDEPERAGDSPLTRFPRDVTAPAGVTDVVLHIGTNDLAAGSDADEVVDGLQRYVVRAHAAGRRVFLTTITPSAAGPHGARGAVSARIEINDWIRERGPAVADGVFDFAAAVADPADPDRLAEDFDSGDGLHLSAAGYRALAGAVDLAALTGSPCRAGPATGG